MRQVQLLLYHKLRQRAFVYFPNGSSNSPSDCTTFAASSTTPVAATPSSLRKQTVLAVGAALAAAANSEQLIETAAQRQPSASQQQWHNNIVSATTHLHTTGEIPRSTLHSSTSDPAFSSPSLNQARRPSCSH